MSALRRALIALVTVVVLGSTGGTSPPRVVAQAGATPSICDPAQVMRGCPESTPASQCDPAQVMLGCPEAPPPPRRPPPPRPPPPPLSGWRGTVVIEYTRAATDSTTTDYGSGSYISNSHDESTTITDTYELTGVDGPSARTGEEETPPPPPGCQYGAQPGELICEEETPPPPPGLVALNGRDSLSGEISITDTVITVSKGAVQDMGHPDRLIGCDYDKSAMRVQDGGWSLVGDAAGVLSLMADGTYQITLQTGATGDVTVPGTEVDTFEPHRGIDCAPASSSTTGFSTDPSSSATLYLSADGIRGQIDPANPGDTISGSQTETGADGEVLTVTWIFVHDGPIQLP